ncbi:MAG: hypothetical protein GTN70_09205 [Deltaproteobacteria bacterium]|nr:hypothetical protein [Deltaproteobacteria bacterium]NIS77955.1 hypothetical protein [Deltaproteobacteria bacterium]
MTEFQMKVLSLVVIAVATIIYVYAPWKPKKQCPSCGLKVDKELNHCPKCSTALL